MNDKRPSGYGAASDFEVTTVRKNTEKNTIKEYTVEPVRGGQRQNVSNGSGANQTRTNRSSSRHSEPAQVFVNEHARRGTESTPRQASQNRLSVESVRPQRSSSAKTASFNTPRSNSAAQTHSYNQERSSSRAYNAEDNAQQRYERPRSTADVQNTAQRFRTSQTQNSFEVSQQRAARGTENQKRRLNDKSNNYYKNDPAQNAREKHRDELQKQHYERQKALDNELSLFCQRTQPRNYWVNLLLTTCKMMLVSVIIICLSGVGFVLGMANSYLESVPELDYALISNQAQSTVLYDKNNELLGNYYSLENREWASLDAIPLNLQNAVIAIEDVRFRRHMGIDFKRLMAAILSNLSSSSVQGGSTITQQLIKNTVLSFEQTYKRKIQEASLALELEKNYSKDQILEAYLNTIYMGGSCYGVKTAAMDYFGKDLSQLTLRECACLAGMIQNPSRYSPRSNYYTRNNPARTDNRTNLVLYEMYENGLITKEEYDAAKADKFTVQEISPYASQTSMIYFTDYVIDSVVDEFLELRGLEDNSANRQKVRNEIRTEGYRIYTTLEGDRQAAAEKAVYEYKNYPNMKSSKYSYTSAGTNPDGTVIRLVQPQAAVAVVDYHNGYISALVGGRQAPLGALQFNRSYQSDMPVGSSIKPLAVYGPAIENGSGAGTVYYNVKQRINGWGSSTGYPANNNRTYPGWMTMRTAIVASYNVTAAQALMYDVGLDQAYNTLVNLGVNPDHIMKTGAGLALGTSGITPLEMAGAFAAIANMGVYIQPIAFTKVEDKNGNVIIDMLSKQESHRVFSESTAWQLIDLLYDVVNSGARRALVSGQTVYGKTGTNSEMRGVFFAGFTGYYASAVWIGHDRYHPLVSDAQGGKYAGPLFSAVMTAMHKGLSNKKCTEVTAEQVGVAKVKYCSKTGKLASEYCPTTHTEYGNPSNMQVCDVHVSVKICSASGKLATEKCPEDQCSSRVIVKIPDKGLLNYMYYNYYSDFVRFVGTPTANMSSCDVHK